MNRSLFFLVNFCQTFADGLENDPAHRQIAIASVRSFDDDPWRFCCTGVTNNAFVYGTKLVVKLVMFLIALGDTPAGLGALLQ